MRNPVSSHNGPPIELHYLGCVWRFGEPVASAAIPHDGSGVAAPSDAQVSSTAIGTALMRGAHARLDPDPLINDSWADRLVPEFARASYRDLAVAKLASESGGSVSVAPDAALDAMLVTGSGFTNVLMRARYTEDALRDSVGRGTRQYVILGAGFDSFALRTPPFAQGVAVFEIDRAATQALKRRRIEECGRSIPECLHFIAADLAKDDVAATLSRSVYRPDLPAFFAWLGVTMFLTREANLATLRAIASCSAPGSELVFTYLDSQIFLAQSPRFRRMQESVRSVGEPFQSGFDPGRLEDDLRRVGFELVEDLTEAEVVERYASTGKDFIIPLDHSRIARARVSS